MELTLQNFIYFSGRLGPFILSFFFVIASIFNQDWKGLLYLSGLLVAITFTIMLSNTTLSLFEDPISIGALCSTSDATVSRYPLSSVVIGFTLFYIFLPMLMLSGGISNPLLIIVLLTFVFTDCAFILGNSCSRMRNGIGSFVPLIIAYGIGGLTAYLFVLLVTSTDKNELLYYGTAGSGPLCKLSRSNKMKCRVFKNGELVTTR
jgi:hypothetical protein